MADNNLHFFFLQWEILWKRIEILVSCLWYNMKKNLWEFSEKEHQSIFPHYHQIIGILYIWYIKLRACFEDWEGLLLFHSVQKLLYVWNSWCNNGSNCKSRERENILLKIACQDKAFVTFWFGLLLKKISAICSFYSFMSLYPANYL